MMEGNALAFFETTCAWFTNVVIQRCKSSDAKIEFTRRIKLHVLNNCKRVRQYVFMPMNRVLFKAHQFHLWKEMINKASIN